MLTAFREGKNFDGIREALKENPAYKEKTENFFIFPDEHNYKQAISNLLKVSLDIKPIIVKDELGNAVNIDE